MSGFLFNQLGTAKTRTWAKPAVDPATVGWSWESPHLEVARVLSSGSDTMFEPKRTTLPDLGFRLAKGSHTGESDDKP